MIGDESFIKQTLTAIVQRAEGIGGLRERIKNIQVDGGNNVGFQNVLHEFFSILEIFMQVVEMTQCLNK